MTFIYVFMPILCITYFCIFKKLRNTVLLIASLIFYAWGEPRFLLVMLITIFLNYAFGILISECLKKEESLKSKQRALVFLVIGIICNLSILGYFKYFNFVLENISSLFSVNFDIVKIVLPLGISFYTFQSLSYLVDVYRKDAQVQTNPFKLALYVALFPQLIAGPIVKYQDIKDQIDDRKIDLENIIYGIKRFVIGLSKKMLIANTCGEIADKIFNQNADAYSPLIAWIGILSYTLQIFYDFSGYSDMAIGLGHIFGFKFKENFNYPYISKSIGEFWRRWHISLSTWFKLYLYIPLGGNRVSSKRTYLNLFIVFFATGIWHGAAWTFVLWGLWNALFIIIERFFRINMSEENTIIRKVCLHLYCIFVFSVGWVLFRADNLDYAISFIGNMFGIIEHSKNLYTLVYYVDNIQLIAIVLGLLFATPIAKNLMIACQKTAVTEVLYDTAIIILLLVSTAFIAASTYNPFIYFRF